MGLLNRLVYSLDQAERRLAQNDTYVRLAVRVRDECQRVIGFHLGDTHHFEHNGESLLVEHVARTCRYVVDVGANVGLWSDAMLTRMPADARLLACEPAPEAFAALEQRLRGDPRVTLLEAALSDRSGTAAFFAEVNAGERSSFVAKFNRVEARRIEVPMSTLDAELERLGWPHVDFLKIDVEGFDAHVLSGARAQLAARRVRLIQFEYNAPWREAGATLAGALARLTEHGYTTFLLKKDGLHEFRYERFGEYYRYSNFVAVLPESRAVVEGVVRSQTY